MFEVMLRGTLIILAILLAVNFVSLVVDNHLVWQNLERFAWYRRRVGGAWVRVCPVRSIEPIRWVQGEPTQEDLRIGEFDDGIIVTVEQY